MRRHSGLARNIATHMALVSMCGFTLSAIAAFFIYSWVFENHPGVVAPPDNWVPQTVDYLVIGAAILTALAVAVLIGRQLARRIILPLTSLAQAAQQISGGDLAARATMVAGAARETAALVDDFNHMASQLDGLTRDMVEWNAVVAHELRTPVTILKGRLQGVADGVFEMDAATLSSLLRQVDGLARLVEDLRVVSLADSGQLDLRTELIDLAQVTDDLRTIAEPTLEAAGFHTEWRLAPVMTNGDPTRLRQAALALIENARIHATPGRLIIHVQKQNGLAVLSVQDDGPGVAPDVRDKLFRTFQRGGGSSGSGLGLAVVKAIAEAHEGEAAMRSSIANGSIFEMRLPIVSGSAAWADGETAGRKA